MKEDFIKHLEEVDNNSKCSNPMNSYQFSKHMDQLTNQEFIEHYESNNWTNTNKEQRYWGLKLEQLKEEIENE